MEIRVRGDVVFSKGANFICFWLSTFTVEALSFYMETLVDE